jgi:hypothetical protein
VAVTAPVPAVAQQRRAGLPGVFVYWHLLSLDAPTVAVLWAWSFARATRVSASAAALSVLAIGTWLVYITDRLLDTRTGAARRDLRERHFFHARHRRALLAAGLASLLPLFCLIARMSALARRDDTILFAIAMVYFAAVHLPARRMRFPRELAVGLVFASACAVPAWSASPATHADLLRLVPLFAALCWLNCAAIHAWEHPTEFQRGSPISLMAVAVAASAAALMFVAGTEGPGILRLDAATLAAAMLLFALDRDRRRALQRADPEAALSLLTLRILADSALLTPLLLLIPWHL